MQWFTRFHGKNSYGIHSQTQLPYISTPSPIIIRTFEALAKNHDLGRDKNQKFIDLGSGTGDVVIYCAKNFKIKVYGVEINNTLLKESRSRKKRLGLHNLKIIGADLFQVDLQPYDYVYIFSPPYLHRYLAHVFDTARHGTIVVSPKWQLEVLADMLELKEVVRSEFGGNSYEVYIYSRKIK